MYLRFIFFPFFFQTNSHRSSKFSSVDEPELSLSLLSYVCYISRVVLCNTICKCGTVWHFQNVLLKAFNLMREQFWKVSSWQAESWMNSRENGNAHFCTNQIWSLNDHFGSPVLFFLDECSHITSLATYFFHHQLRNKWQSKRYLEVEMQRISKNCIAEDFSSIMIS